MPHLPRRPRLSAGRALLGGAAVLLLGVAALSSPTLSGWTSGSVTNSTNSAKTGTGTLSFTHSYTNPGATTCGVVGATDPSTCPQSIAPLSVPATGSNSIADSIKNGVAGSTGVTTSLVVPTCGPVELANQRAGDDNPMLPRYGGWTYGAAGPRTDMPAVTLGGVNAEAASLRSRPYTKPSATYSYAIGVWFNVAAGSPAMPLVTLSTEALGNTRGAERTGLTIYNDGMLQAFYSPTAAAYTKGKYADGKWHFAYVQYTASAINYYIDGSATSDTNGTFVDFPASDTTPAYWRIGRSSDSFTGIQNQFYFKGSLSNVVIFSGATLPAPPTTAQLASQSTFDAWATTATEHWKLNDSGTTIHTGTKPAWLDTAACAQVNMAWSATSPAVTSVTQTLAGWTTAKTGAAPLGGTTPTNGTAQTSTLALSRISGFDPDGVGLWLLPTIRMTHAASTGWGQTFTWSSTPATSRILVQ